MNPAMFVHPNSTGSIRSWILLLDIKDAATFRAEHPFVAVRRQGMNSALLHIERKSAQSLNRIDKEQRTATVADLTDRLKIGAIPAQILHKADRQQPSPPAASSIRSRGSEKPSHSIFTPFASKRFQGK